MVWVKLPLKGRRPQGLMCWELGMKLLEESDIEAYKEEKKEVKRCIYQTNNKANNQFGKKMK